MLNMSSPFQASILSQELEESPEALIGSLDAFWAGSPASTSESEAYSNQPAPAHPHSPHSHSRAHAQMADRCLILTRAGYSILARMNKLARQGPRALPTSSALRNALVAAFPEDPKHTCEHLPFDAIDADGYREWYSTVDAKAFNQLSADVAALEDAAAFHEHATALLREAAEALTPAEVDAARHPALLAVLADVVALVVRVAVAADAVPRLLIIQAHGVLECGRFQTAARSASQRAALSNFVAAFSPPIPRVQLDLAPATLLVVALLEAEPASASAYLARADPAQIAYVFEPPLPGAPTLFGRGTDDVAAAQDTERRITALSRLADAHENEARVVCGVLACPYALAAAPPAGMLVTALREILSSTRSFDLHADGAPADLHAMLLTDVVGNMDALRTGTPLGNALDALGVSVASVSSCAKTWRELIPRLHDTAQSDCIERRKMRGVVTKHALESIARELRDVVTLTSREEHGEWILDRWLTALAALRMHGGEVTWALRHARFCKDDAQATAYAAAAVSGLSAHHTAYASARAACARAAVAASRALSHALNAHLKPPLDRLSADAPPGEDAKALVRSLVEVREGAAIAAADAYAALSAQPQEPPPDIGRFRLGMLRTSVAMCDRMASARAGLLDTIALTGPGGLERPGRAHGTFAVGNSVIGALSRIFGHLSHAVDRAGAWLDEHARLDATFAYIDDAARLATSLAKDPREPSAARVQGIVPALAFVCASAVNASPPAAKPAMHRAADAALSASLKTLAAATGVLMERIVIAPCGPYALETAIMRHAISATAQFQRDTAGSPGRRRSSISPLAGATSALSTPSPPVNPTRRRRSSSISGAVSAVKLMQKSPPLPGVPGSESEFNDANRAALAPMQSAAERLAALLADFDDEATEVHAAAVLNCDGTAAPRDLVVGALAEAFRSYFRRSAASPAPEDSATGINAGCVRGPEGLMRSVEAATNVLANVQPHAPRIDLAKRVVRDTLDAEAKDDTKVGGTVLTWYAEFYDRYVVCDVGGCSASHDPNNCQFATGSDARARLGGNVPLLEEYTSPAALAALAKMLGPVGVGNLDARFSQRMCDAFVAMDNLVRQNAPALAELAAAAEEFNQERAAGALKLLGEDVVIAAHAHLVAFGRTLALRGLWRAAAGEVRASESAMPGGNDASAPEVLAHAFLASEFDPNQQMTGADANVSKTEASKMAVRMEAQQVGIGDANALPTVPRGVTGLLAAAASGGQGPRAPDASSFGRYLTANVDARAEERASLFPALLASTFGDSEAWTETRFDATKGGFPLSTHLIADASVHIIRGLSDAFCKGRRAAAAVHIGAYVQSQVTMAGLLSLAQAGRDRTGMLRPYPDDAGYRARVLVLDRMRMLLSPDEQEVDGCVDAFEGFAPSALVRSAYESMLEGAPPGLEIPPPPDCD